ncbi:MAG: malto-oligosyltrehalose synthase [Xanthobacteraceae bacterium]|nr:malto-oligosyltrehalose synthase [Xanthobacteraceae bacterium]
MPRSLPLATYRLQLTSKFTFDDAAAVVPYLAELGISHVYASPFMWARAGSTHGYDVINHAALNPDLGGEDGFARLSQALARANLGLILDFVPNHMAVNGADNAWWLDVLEWGPASPYAPFFDIDWARIPHRPKPGVLLPLLGRPYAEALTAGEIDLRFDPHDGSFSAWYFDHRLPIAPQCYAGILRRVAGCVQSRDATLAAALRTLAHERADTPEHARALKSALAQLSGGADLIQSGLRAYRPDRQQPAATATLHRLVERQNYRLAHWQLASSNINYRRFFDINNLAALRVEYPPAFAAIHPLVLRLISDGRLHGLRLDHIDGLWDPDQYCARLRDAIAEAQPDRSQHFYTVVEKILEPHESLPPFPGVAGTTGYEWLNAISRVLIEPRGLSPLAQTWRDFTGEQRIFADVLTEAKRYVIANLLASEFTTLVQLLGRIAAGHCGTRDFAPSRLRDALEAFVLQFPIYRTYIAADRVSEADQHIITETIAAARGQETQDQEIFAFLEALLTLDLIAPGRRTHSRRRVLQFVGKLQQLTGPLMAKSLEDTAFYRDHAILALNEVGGRPDAGALAPSQFHEAMAERASSWPHGLTATATHDTKRGEDARMRLLAMSELAPDWAAAAPEWHRLNDSLAQSTCGSRAPSLAHEYLFYEVLLGAWPSGKIDVTFTERMQAFMLKAAREGKQQTSWLNPNPEYERSLQAFVAGALEPGSAFLAAAKPLADRIARLGALNSLSQLTLKAMMPGVPDFYQGSEFWDLSLVDPDNRRPVDFAARAGTLAQVEAIVDWEKLAHSWQDGVIKLALTHQLLRIRRQYQQLFEAADYRPVLVNGPHQDHVIAFARIHAGNAVIVVVGRRFAQLTDGGRRWPRAADWNAELDITGFDQIEILAPNRAPVAQARLSALFATIPVAILRAEVRQ